MRVSLVGFPFLLERDHKAGLWLCLTYKKREKYLKINEIGVFNTLINEI